MGKDIFTDIHYSPELNPGYGRFQWRVYKLPPFGKRGEELILACGRANTLKQALKAIELAFEEKVQLP